MVVALAGRSLPTRLERKLSVMGPAVLAAIVANSLFVRHGTPAAPPRRLLGVIAAVLVVARTRRPTRALLVGLLVACLATLLLPA